MKRTVLFLLCISSLSFVIKPLHLFGWGLDNHRLITKEAIGLLPEWERETMGIYADSLSILYCVYPDRYGHPEKFGEYREGLKKYHEIPYLHDDGIFHSGVARNEIVFDNIPDFYLFTYYIEHAIRNLRAGNVQEAARYMGVITHYVEDSNCPVHILNNRLLTQLYPPPERFEFYNVHRTVERAPMRNFKVQYYVPKKLGDSVFDAINAIIPIFNQMRIYSRSQAAPILVSIFENNFNKANDERKKTAVPGVKLLADIYHTIFCIAFDR